MSADGADIIEALRVRPVPFEHRTTKRITFDLPNRAANTSPLKAKFKAADSRKKRSYTLHRANMRIGRPDCKWQRLARLADACYGFSTNKKLEATTLAGVAS